MCYLFLFASLIEFTAVHYFTKVTTDPPLTCSIFSLKLTHWLVIDFKVGYGDIQNISFDELTDEKEPTESKKPPDTQTPGKESYSVRMYLKDVWKCVVNDFRFKQEMTKRAHYKGINSVSKCDRFARIFFPATFLLFNIIYWYTFYKFM